jgi:hypothetical protein
VLCAGASGDPDANAHVRRYTDLGVLDPAFGVAGVFTVTDYVGVNDRFGFVSETPLGGYVLGGSTDTPATFTIRLDANGDLITTWGTNGKQTYSTGPFAVGIPTASKMLPNGDFVATGVTVDNNPVMHLDVFTTYMSGSDGTIQTWYGSDGFVVLDVDPGDNWTWSEDISIGTDGQVAVAGRIDDADDSSFIIQFQGESGEDFALNTFDWDSGTSTVFGVCLRSYTVGTPEAPWVKDTGDDCLQTDADDWRPIPMTALDTGGKLAERTAIGGANATVSLRFGVRAADDQTPGVYQAPITFEVLAPNA